MITIQRARAATTTAAIVLGIAVAGGCGSNMGAATGLVAGGTGVSGFDTPEQILSNPFVDALVREIERGGLDLNLSRAVDPPVVSGSYSMAGELVHPFTGPLGAGDWTWSNQTSDNHIHSSYDQITGQSGVSTVGEIIRGEGKAFTVYAVFRITQGGCEETAISIVDGEQDSTGNVSAVYLVTPIEQSSCYTPSVGLLQLTLTGASRVIPAALDGAGLIASIE